MRQRTVDKTLLLPYLLPELSPLNCSIKGGFICHVCVNKWCWITSSVIYKQAAFGEHSSLPAIHVCPNIIAY